MPIGRPARSAVARHRPAVSPRRASVDAAEVRTGPQHMAQTTKPPRRTRALPRGVALVPGVVRDLRIKLGKAQIELADAATVSVDTIGRAENGTPISLESATAIA